MIYQRCRLASEPKAYNISVIIGGDMDPEIVVVGRTNEGGGDPRVVPGNPSQNPGTPLGPYDPRSQAPGSIYAAFRVLEILKKDLADDLRAHGYDEYADRV